MPFSGKRYRIPDSLTDMNCPVLERISPFFEKKSGFFFSLVL